jgi:hypothetical protein
LVRLHLFMMDEMKWNGMGWEANDSIDWMDDRWTGHERQRVSELIGK